MKRVILILACLLIPAVLLTAFSTSVKPAYPDLTQEYLRTFDPPVEFIVESGEQSNMVRVYDGATGAFLFETSINPEEGRTEALGHVLQEAAQHKANQSD